MEEREKEREGIQEEDEAGEAGQPHLHPVQQRWGDGGGGVGCGDEEDL